MSCKTLLGSGLLVLLAFTLHCTEAPTQPNPPGTHTVDIFSDRFSPRNLTISVGDRVIWENQDNVSHSVDSGTFMNPTTAFEGTKNINPGSGDTVTFTERGTFPYYCSIHQSGGVKEGTIIVN